jgi:2-polyprenyl-3-methyl-5-hydroxy-6-metoxy-1,4-benzoquinol methylase
VSSGESFTFFGRSDAVKRGELTPTEHVVCPLCGVEPRAFAVDFQGFTLCRCDECVLEFVSPRLTFDELSAKVYSDNYLPKRDEATWRTAEAVHTFSQQLANFEGLVGGPKTILDIGCGNGAFLDLALGSGWTIAGVDIKLADDARELDCPLWEGRLEEIDFCGKTFTVVRLNHVLEHTQDPLNELKICRGLVAPGGILFISVPNIAGISPRLKSLQSRLHLKSHRWRHYAAMHHLFFFSPRTLTALVERAGFRVLEWETPVPRKRGRGALVEVAYQIVLGSTRHSSILDVYCTPA